jgi:hypothetical protein
VHVLRNMVEAVKPGGLVLDLQVIRPNPTVEVDGQAVCEIDGEPLFRSADAATDAVGALVRTRQLVEQASTTTTCASTTTTVQSSSTISRTNNARCQTALCRSFAGSRNGASCASAVAFGVSRCADLMAGSPAIRPSRSCRCL